MDTITDETLRQIVAEANANEMYDPYTIAADYAYRQGVRGAAWKQLTDELQAQIKRANLTRYPAPPAPPARPTHPYRAVFTELKPDGDRTEVTVHAPDDHEAFSAAVKQVYGRDCWFHRDGFRPGCYGQIFRRLHGHHDQHTSVTGRIRYDLTRADAS